MRRIAMFALAGTLAACSMDSTGPNGSVEASYTLRTINGQPLPYTFPSGRRLINDRLVLHRAGTYEDLSTWSDGSTTLDEGDYDNYNGSLTFYSTLGDQYQGSVTGDVLTQFLNGYTQRFDRD